jgi:hypothetical protein
MDIIRGLMSGRPRAGSLIAQWAKDSIELLSPQLFSPLPPLPNLTALPTLNNRGSYTYIFLHGFPVMELHRMGAR